MAEDNPELQAKLRELEHELEVCCYKRTSRLVALGNFLVHHVQADK